VRERVRHPIFARFYARVSPGAEARGAAEHRRELLAGLTGRVLELGAGNGLSFPHYPATVSELVAVEPEKRYDFVIVHDPQPGRAARVSAAGTTRAGSGSIITPPSGARRCLRRRRDRRAAPAGRRPCLR
jgi:hypothetical protein